MLFDVISPDGSQEVNLSKTCVYIKVTLIEVREIVCKEFCELKNSFFIDN